MTIKLIFVASPLITQQKGERAKIGWLGVQNKYHYHLIEMQLVSCHDIADKLLMWQQ
jgi:hypothetical protein